MPLRRYSGVFGPADLEMLQKVFDQMCAERNVAEEDLMQRDEIADQVVTLFQRGVMDEAELMKTLSKGGSGNP
jgi:hypothetical protein